MDAQATNDAQKIADAWRSALMDNLPIIANFSAMVLRQPSTNFLADQNATYKNLVLRRFKPLVPDEETFENMFTTMIKENNCESEDPPPVVLNDLVNNFIFTNSLRDWHRAECLRKINLKQSFFDIDVFYDFSDENVEDFCSNPIRAERVLERKTRQFVEALQRTDAIITAMIEDLTRAPNSVAKPTNYDQAYEDTKRVISLEFISRIGKKVLDKPCPKPDASRQLRLIVGSRPTRPTRQAAKLSPSAERVDEFLLKTFNRRNP